MVSRVKPSVVQITATTSSGTSLGSGVVYDTKGDIVTNDHVVLGSTNLSVQLASGGAPLIATLVGAFGPDDLAVVKIQAAKGLLHPATFANSAKLAVGDIVLAIGNPLAFESSVTEGIISATGRTVSEPPAPGSPGGTIANAIQTSASINPGNSGGALVDLSGQVVGIPTLTAVDPQIGGAAAGIGFAIPSNTVTDIAGQVIAHGHVVNSHRADLGITAFDAADYAGRPLGVGVQSTLAGGPAAKAGIQAGSVLTSVNGTQVQTLSDLEGVLVHLKPGQQVKVGLIRPSGAKATVDVTLGTLPGNSSAG